MDPLAPGTVLFGKYRLEEVIGVGGMGKVVRASHLYLQQSVAIKILLPQMAESSSTVQRFLREAQSAVQLKSEHTARVIDVGTMHDGVPFMVMEHLSGNDLNQILRHHGPQPAAIVCDLMLQACEGMAEAHALGIVHRDIKPSNFFITQRPDGSMLLKILDFGISKQAVGLSELTGTQTVIGTPTYMAPEQMKSGKIADARSDIWSIGVVMYQLLTGRPPFEAETYAGLVLKVNGEPPQPMHVPLPAGLGEVILRCLEKDPKDRQQNVGELSRMLAPFATDPVAAALAAARTTRTLTHKGGGGSNISPLAAGGGLATPAPLSPAQLTPRSWPPSSTSLSAGAGQQLTYRTRGARGWVIAGVAGLVILAGAGGFIVNEVMKEDEPTRRNEPYVTAPAAAAEPIPAPPPEVKPAEVKPAEVKPAEVKPAEVTASTEAKPPTPTITPTIQKTIPDAPKTEPKTAKTEPKTAKTEPKTAKTVKTPSETKIAKKAEPKSIAKTEPKSEVKKPKDKGKGKTKGEGDLFDTRH